MIILLLANHLIDSMTNRPATTTIHHCTGQPLYLFCGPGRILGAHNLFLLLYVTGNSILLLLKLVSGRECSALLSIPTSYTWTNVITRPLPHPPVRSSGWPSHCCPFNLTNGYRCSLWFALSPFLSIDFIGHLSSDAQGRGHRTECMLNTLVYINFNCMLN